MTYKITRLFFIGLFPIWGKRIKLDLATFSSIVLSISVFLSPSFLYTIAPPQWGLPIFRRTARVLNYYILLCLAVHMFQSSQYSFSNVSLMFATSARSCFFCSDIFNPLYSHHHWAGVVSRCWLIESACRLQVSLTCTVLGQIVSLQIVSPPLGWSPLSFCLVIMVSKW